MRAVWFFVAAATLVGCQGEVLELSTTAQLTVVTNPSAVTFATTTVGATSAPVTITINPGLAANFDTVTAITESCPDFSLSAPGLPADVYRECEPTCGTQTCLLLQLPCTTAALQSYAFTAQFTPSIGGAQSCAVSINLNNGTTFKTVTLNGTGMVPPIDIAVSPPAIGFGDVRVVLGAIDRPHTTDADLIDHAVAAEDLADHDVRFFRRAIHTNARPMGHAAAGAASPTLHE